MFCSGVFVYFKIEKCFFERVPQATGELLRYKESQRENMVSAKPLVRGGERERKYIR